MAEKEIKMVGKSFEQWEACIDRQQTIIAMKRELQQLYYYKDHDLVEDSALDYLSYTSSIVYAGKKQKHSVGDERLIKAIEEKDRMRALQQQIEAQRKQITDTLLEGIEQLPEKERTLIQDIYVHKRDKAMIAYSLGISFSTLRRKQRDACFHLALLLHKTIPFDKNS